MKNILLILIISSFTSLTYASFATPDSISRKSQRIADRIDRKAYRLDDATINEIDDHLESIKSLLTRGGEPGNCHDGQRIYREAYEWAYSSSGMDKPRYQAEEFAKKMEDLCDYRGFVTYKSAYEWAYSSEGMDKPRYQSEEFADNIITKSSPRSYFICYKDAYDFARNTMDKPRYQAEEHAEERCN